MAKKHRKERPGPTPGAQRPAVEINHPDLQKLADVLRAIWHAQDLMCRFADSMTLRHAGNRIGDANDAITDAANAATAAFSRALLELAEIAPKRSLISMSLEERMGGNGGEA